MVAADPLSVVVVVDATDAGNLLQYVRLPRQAEKLVLSLFVVVAAAAAKCLRVLLFLLIPVILLILVLKTNTRLLRWVPLADPAAAL